jgi:hypothetical protein
MRPQDSRSPGPFLWSEQRRRDGGRGTAVPGERQRRAACATRSAGVGGRDAGPDGRPEVLRPARRVAAPDAAAFGLRRVGLRRRARLRRLVDPGLAGDLGVGHAAHAGSVERRARPVRRRADAVARLRDRRPGHARALRQGSPPHREASRGVPSHDRDRRHGLLRPRVRVLRPRRDLVRARRPQGALRARLGGGTPAVPGSVTRFGRRRVTSRRRRTTLWATSARRWC